MKYYFVQRIVKKDGNLIDAGIVDIPEKDIKATLARNPLWKIVKEPVKEVEAVAELVAQVALSPVGTTCPLCQKSFKNANGLRLHKRSHD